MKFTVKHGLMIAVLLMLSPEIADAHSTATALHGWRDGFNHPLHGWDHLVAMVAVGAWAARQRGYLVWLIPAAFVTVMGIGGIAGAAGVSVPGVEIAILLSVVVFAVLVVREVRLAPTVSVLVVGFFAFFHGFAHGAELPSSLSVAFGFLLGTLSLHGMGLAAVWLVTFGTALALGGSAIAQETTEQPVPQPESNVEQKQKPVRLEEVVVKGRADSLLGVADSATQGTVGAKQLEERPIQRTGEILETVPGLITTQHAGGGKANQYFLRGFNLDHGTDFYTSLDGMPVNLPSHGHGQGYTDLNIVIPELVRRVNYHKGVYYAENGDFSSAGAARLEFFKELPKKIAIVEGGMYGYARGVFAASPKVGRGTLLSAVELYHYDGPWDQPDDYQKYNALLTYSQGHEDDGFSVTARGYHGEWNSSDQVAKSAVDDNLVDFFGSLDDTTGGNSQRYSLQGEWHRVNEDHATNVMAYVFYYDLDLFSNFTYFLVDTARGDQFEQTDTRVTFGLNANHTLFNQWWGRDVENVFGLQVRNDDIENGLYNTQSRTRMDKVNSADGSVIPATTRKDDIFETSVGLYFENKIQWAEKFRSVAGLRTDIYNFDVNSELSQNSDHRADAIVSPKLSLIFGPWWKTELYVQGGLGFHSNDARGVTTRVDPITGLPTDPDGNPIKRADPLVQTEGAEVGVRTTYVPGLQSTVSLWWLDIDSELLFVGDAGTTEASRPSRRYGVEWANYYDVMPWLTLDADLAFSHAEFRDDEPEGNHIPGSIDRVISAGITYHTDPGPFASLRVRDFGPRPLIEDDSFRSDETVLVDAQAGYHFNATWTFTAQIFNLLDTKDHDIDYAYESRVRPTDAPVTQIHFHPVEPIQARFALSARF